MVDFDLDRDIFFKKSHRKNEVFITIPSNFGNLQSHDSKL